jgi:disulfide bond formation protein DsbB
MVKSLKFTLSQLSIYYVTVSVMMLLLVHIMQVVFHIYPCELCLYQRYPYYAALFGAVLVPLHFERLAVMLQTLMFGIGGIIALYHSGIERHLWQGFTRCSTVSSDKSASVADILSQIQNTPLVKCTDIAFSVMGLSLTNYNVILSVILCGVGVYHLIPNQGDNNDTEQSGE